MSGEGDVSPHRRFPLGAAATVEELADAPYGLLAALRAAEPVSWLPALGTWLVTGRRAAIEAMGDDGAFTVDDPRFTTGAVLGPSMLSADGPEHERLRAPFVPPFTPGALRSVAPAVAAAAAALVEDLAPAGRAELRTGLAGPLAVATITRLLGLDGLTTGDVLGWYRAATSAITDLTTTGRVRPTDQAAVARLGDRLAAAAGGGESLLATITGRGALSADEAASGAAVLLFGAIETAEGMTANAFWHLLSTPGAWEEVGADRSLVGPAVEESLRLEPAAAVVDRYATRDVELAGVTIPAGDPVTISLLAANRDPEVFEWPDRFDPRRANAARHVTFARGPHRCIGLHLARMETTAAIEAALDGLGPLTLDRAASRAPSGLIFRKPAAVVARWPPR